jgi:hypothetical protein
MDAFGELDLPIASRLTFDLFSWVLRRDARVVDRGGLENRYAG